MDWLGKHRRTLRVVILVVLLVSLVGPWAFDRIHVPSAYPCTQPHVRLDGDFCGLPVSGLFIILTFLGQLPALIGASAAALGGGSVAERFLVLTALVFAPLLVFASTLLLIPLGGHKPLERFALPSWGIAVVSGVWLAGLTPDLLSAPTWGLWLYLILAVAALISEGMALWAGRAAQRNQPSRL